MSSHAPAFMYFLWNQGYDFCGPFVSQDNIETFVRANARYAQSKIVESKRNQILHLFWYFFSVNMSCLCIDLFLVNLKLEIWTLFFVFVAKEMIFFFHYKNIAVGRWRNILYFLCDLLITLFSIVVVKNEYFHWKTLLFSRWKPDSV